MEISCKLIEIKEEDPKTTKKLSLPPKGEYLEIITDKARNIFYVSFDKFK